MDVRSVPDPADEHRTSPSPVSAHDGGNTASLDLVSTPASDAGAHSMWDPNNNPWAASTGYDDSGW
jgi:hypothetical protein